MKKPKRRFKVERKIVAQVRYYEELHVITDESGHRIYTGDKETAERIAKLLAKDNGHSLPESTALVVAAKRDLRKRAETSRRRKTRVARAKKRETKRGRPKRA